MKRSLNLGGGDSDMNTTCKCGSNDIAIDTDDMTQATFIECLQCHRCVGGLSKQDAIEMWDKIVELHGER